MVIGLYINHTLNDFVLIKYVLLIFLLIHLQISTYKFCGFNGKQCHIGGSSTRTGPQGSHCNDVD